MRLRHSINSWCLSEYQDRMKTPSPKIWGGRIATSTHRTTDMQEKSVPLTLSYFLDTEKTARRILIMTMDAAPTGY